MPRPVPDPVQNFFVCFLSNPNGRDSLRRLCINLLDLEVGRAKHNVLFDVPGCDASEDYRQDVVKAVSVLKLARRYRTLGHNLLNLPCQWLTLLGHRLAVERALSVEGIPALAHVAATEFDLPLRETETWPDDMLFVQYTQTVLRQEWDYAGIQFRYKGSAWPPEKS